MRNTLNEEIAHLAIWGKNRKMGKEYDNFGHFPQIEGLFLLDQQLFSSPFLQIADLFPSPGFLSLFSVISAAGSSWYERREELSG